MKSRKKIHENIHLYLACTIAFTMPFARLTPVFIALLFLNWLIEGRFSEKWENLRKSKFLWFMLLFYLLHVIGLIHTEDMKAGAFDLQVKLSLFLFPLILGTVPLGLRKFAFIGLSFIGGCVFVSLLLIFRSSYIWFTLGENHFFYQAFSILMHPSYFAMYLTTALLICLYLYGRSFFFRSWIVLVPVFILIGITEVLLSSKMGLFVLAFIGVYGVIRLILIRKKYLLGLIGLLGGTLAFILIVTQMPTVSARMEQLFKTLNKKEISYDNNESSAVRILIWKASNQIVANNLLIGVGTGDVKESLKEKYQELGMRGAYLKGLNAHNAYYQTTIAIGVPALILFILSLFTPLWMSWRKKQWLYALFILSFFINCLVESMLETQAGVIYFGFFSCLFWSHFGLSSEETEKA
ncbi:MAG: hypothetical protein EP338_05920 [Bacteroidetes bacterium]|nr:MAG: hypothetical protein EP338_05920 [Bacteroidota bacterium]